jgi:XTP/dITP diphosphohydrolase
MNKLLIATHNPAKKQELKEGFSRFKNLSLLSLDDLHISADPEETGSTFFENAQLKARYFAKLSGLPTVADDGGIEIDALGGEPGVHSKRWLGYDATDEEMIAYTLKKLQNIPIEKRTAHFTVCLYYINPLTGMETSVTESVNGAIGMYPSGKARKGFPYRALFIVDTYNKYYDELTEAEHKAVNHRLKAVKKLAQKI